MAHDQGADNTTVGLLEVDPSGPRVSWVFPSLQGKEDMVRVLASRAQLLAPSPSSPPTFTFFRVGSTWYYSLARDRKASNEEDVVHPVVSRFAVFLGAATFHPERYEALLHVLLRAFEAESGSPLALLQRVLSVSTKGIASAPGGADFVASKFGSSLDDESLAGSLSHAVQRLGAAACATLWAAMMLRCRVAVYKESDAAAVLAVVRALPLLTWHRRRWEVLMPLCGLSLADEIQELNSAGTFVAGFTDPAILERSELYDVLVCLDGSGRVSGAETPQLPPRQPPSTLLKLTASGAHLQLPTPIRAEVEAALGSDSGSSSGILGRLEGVTARMLEMARDGATSDGGASDAGDRSDAIFLRRLLDAEGIGASA